MSQIFFHFVQNKFSLEDLALITPKRQSSHASGFDLASSSKEEIIIKPGERKLIPTGISIELYHGLEAQVRSRSGLSYKNGIAVLNSPGTIDADYTGEIKVILINFGEENFIVSFGMRIAQLVICPVSMLDLTIKKDLKSSTSRGENGFGSTGV